VKPVVAIVGRPNVGKSTLFNRLTRARDAIVHDEPGVTRDRHYGEVTAEGRTFSLIDTGGFDPSGDDPMMVGIKRHIVAAIEEADVVVCVLSAREPATSIEHAEMRLLREAKRPIIYVANKADSESDEHSALELYRLGIEDLHTVSALHGKGVPDLLDAIVGALPPESPDEAAPDVPEGTPRIAVIGRPNAGKSSLVNRLLGEERMLVDDRPGTTRDAVDSVVRRRPKATGARGAGDDASRPEKTYVFVDTAGVRRKAKVTKEGDKVEVMSVVQAIRAIERADIVVLLSDSHDGVSEQDAKVLGLAVDRGRAVVVGLNKIDLLEKGELSKREADARDKLAFAPWATFVRLSAKTGRGVDTLLAAVDEVWSAYSKRIGTGELNRFFEQVLETHPPPTQDGKAPRLFFITQASTKPPTFVVQASHPEKLHFSYQRYVQNQIRKTFEFVGVPLVVHYRARRRVELARKESERGGRGTKKRARPEPRAGAKGAKGAKKSEPQASTPKPRAARPKKSTPAKSGSRRG
jgi:GTPase